MSGEPPGAARLSRAWVRPRAALAPLLAAGLGLLAAPALLAPDEAPRAAPSDSAGVGHPLGPPGRAAPAPPSSAPPSSAPPAPAGRPLPDAAPDLPPLAGAWREAILQGQRQQVQSLALALRRAPDGRDLLLRLAGDAQPRVRAYALRELGRRRDPGLRDVFLAAQEDASAPVRENATWALDQLGGR